MFDCVISVYLSTLCHRVNDYIYNVNSPIDILGYNGVLKVPWIDKTDKEVKGTSFSSTLITRRIIEYRKNGFTSIKEIRGFLKKDSKKKYKFNRIRTNYISKKVKLLSKINKIVLFPFTKELYVMLENTDLLTSVIHAVYDTQSSSKVNKFIKEFIHGEHLFEGVIGDYESIDWSEDFDTIVLGHVKELSSLLKVDFAHFFLTKCIKYKKNLYSFDPMDDYSEMVDTLEKQGNIVVTPKISDTYFGDTTFGCLHKSANPILGIVGTSSNQDKFNIDLKLRREFKNRNYDIGQIGTDPSSLLFGMDAMFYNNENNYTANEEVIFFNNLKPSLNDKDIIIFGTQSQTLPTRYGNLNNLTSTLHNQLCALEPDLIILVVNTNDSFDYIDRILKYLESYFCVEIFAFVLLSFEKKSDYDRSGEVDSAQKKECVEIYSRLLIEKYHKNVYVNEKKYEYERLVNSLVLRLS